MTMKPLPEHTHTFAASDWPFRESVNTAAISTTRVTKEGFPVLLVSHDLDGDWQVLCDTGVDLTIGLLTCLGCAYQRDPSIGELADMPRGCVATREFVGAPWKREMREPE